MSLQAFTPVCDEYSIQTSSGHGSKYHLIYIILCHLIITVNSPFSQLTYF